jgi:hypothetical protein
MVTEKDYAKYIALAIAKETPKAFFKNWEVKDYYMLFT